MLTNWLRALGAMAAGALLLAIVGAVVAGYMSHASTEDLKRVEGSGAARDLRWDGHIKDATDEWVEAGKFRGRVDQWIESQTKQPERIP